VTLDDLRLQMRTDVSSAAGRLPSYRFARDNGWVCCGGWHGRLDEAHKCLTERLATKEAA
jgi:hypothetical protein